MPRALLFLLFTLVCVTPSFSDEFRDALRPEWMSSLEPSVELEAGWNSPPSMARTRCWWWWLNGNVTKEVITRDLEEMKAKGLGGANIIDAGGANQHGNRQVPHGPDFGSTEWRELFLHALKEADRLGLELGFNIQSGWNLGGPTVLPKHAAKKLTWSEDSVKGGTSVELQLNEPQKVGDYYQEIAVLAVPVKRRFEDNVKVQVKSSQAEHPSDNVFDGDKETFWVSGSTERGEGPTPSKPQHLEINFPGAVTASEVILHPRKGYGPKRGWVQASDESNRWSLVGRWEAKDRDASIEIAIEKTTAKRFRLVIVDSFDPFSPAAPRNVQIAEIEINHEGKSCIETGKPLAVVKNYQQKAYHRYPGHFTAINADHLLEVGENTPDSEVIKKNKVIDLSSFVSPTGELKWRAPQGNWKVLRIGYTLANSRVSTSSEGWNGWAIDYLDKEAFNQYWQDVIEPILDEAKPYLGKSLRFLHTDSWELGPVNWTPKMASAFEKQHGYSLESYLPVLAGYVVENPETSNRFLNDFRRTLADLIAESKYGSFRDKAHERGLGIHPESGGPHAAPVDALRCLGRSDVMMGEFWARSKTHRVRDHERLFIKQPSSAAHTYGRRVVLAEAFTSIGPHWERDPAMLKPVFDRVACEGLNLVMLHTFDSSPKEMGMPGQVYFAGTHINPNVTWWDQSTGFFDYLNRCQFLLQQGVPVSDVLYFYGENVPSFVRLKPDNPAGISEGYDYDVINAEALIGRLSVKNGKLTLPEGTQYELLVLPGEGHYGLNVLRKISQLSKAGAKIVGVSPRKPMGLVNLKQQREFQTLVTQLWGTNRKIVVQTTPEALSKQTIVADFSYKVTSGSDKPITMDYIHRRTNDAEIYFVVNRTEKPIEADCRFRVTGMMPELWDPLTGETLAAKTYAIEKGQTNLPINLAANGSVFVVFRKGNVATANRSGGTNLPSPRLARELSLDWQVQFDSKWGGPAEPVGMASLSDWSTHENPAIKYFSGTAVYRAELSLSAEEIKRLDSQEWWLDLGKVSNLARVKLNGEDLGVVWTSPYRVNLGGQLKAENTLEIEVVNLWPNRIIGDENLPKEERLTRTNVTKFKADTPLLRSGLLGPIQLLESPAKN